MCRKCEFSCYKLNRNSKFEIRILKHDLGGSDRNLEQ
jgi:hypothetical protein